MGKAQKQWARQKRFELLFLLGGHCVECGTEEDLTFDCKHPCGDAHHRMDTSHRMSFYRRQHREKNLQILCRKCNTKKSVQDLLLIESQQADDNCPF
jgi:5-methylcytosine-specific restriction endonuclease McrA